MKSSKRTRRTAVVTALLTAALAAGTGFTDSASAAISYRTFTNDDNGNCLATNSSNQVITGVCLNATDEQWQIIDTDHLKNRGTGLCLGWVYATAGTKSSMKMQTCDAGSKYQEWYYDGIRLQATPNIPPQTFAAAATKGAHSVFVLWDPDTGTYGLTWTEQQG
jgi:hypothetical protein